MSGYFQQLESKNYVANGTSTLNLEGLPPGYRVRNIMMFFDISGTKGGTDTVTSDALHKAIALIKLQQYFNLTGLEAFRLRHAYNGRIIEDPTAVPGSGTTFAVSFCLEIPFRDPRQSGTDDGSLPVELLNGKSLEVTWAQSTIYGNSAVITAGTVRTVVDLIHETNVPQLIQIGYIDQASQTVRFPPGIYKELFIVNPDGTPVTSSLVGSVDLSADGQYIMRNMRHEQLVGAWNRQAACAAGSRAELVQSLNGGAGPAFLPLVWQDKYGKSNLSKQMAVESYAALQITSGSLLTGRFVFARATLKDAQTIAGTAQLTGAPPNARIYEAATASKTPFHDVTPGQPLNRKERLLNSALPGKVRTVPTPGSVTPA
jgi:hypothetical protein